MNNVLLERLLFKEEVESASYISPDLKPLLDEYETLLNSFNSKQNIYKWADRMTEAGFKEIGDGAYRMVFAIGNQKILKVVKYFGDSKMNRLEVQNFKCLGPEYAPRVYEHNPKFYWVIYERIRPFSLKTQLVQQRVRETFEVDRYITDPEDIKEIRGDYTSTFLRLRGATHIAKKLYQLNLKYKDFVDRLKMCEVGTEDFYPRNIGFRGRRGFVILDATDFRSEYSWEITKP